LGEFLNVIDGVHVYLKKFLSYYRPYRMTLFADLLCALLIAATTVALPLCTQYITKNILGSQASDALRQVYWVAALMLVFIAIHAACKAFMDYQGHMMGVGIEAGMRNELFSHYLKLPFAFYNQQHTGQLMSRLTSDLFDISELAHHGPEDLMIAVLKFTGAFIVLFGIDWQLTAIILLIMVLMLGYALFFHEKIRIAGRVTRERIAEINAQVEDTLAGIRTVQSFANHLLEQEKFAQANQRFIQGRQGEYKSFAPFDAGVQALTQLMTVVVIVFGVLAVGNQRLELADLITYILCLGILIDPIQRFVNFARLYQEGVAGFERFMQMLEIAPSIADAPTAQNLGQVCGEITFQNIGFCYSENQTPVLSNLSLEIKAGEYLALVGVSGVGKTTLCALIPRFYQAQKGAILIDGMNINDIRLESLRQNIGVVQQDVFLFSGSVAENIRYGKLDATEAEIIAAAKKANAHEFIMALPKGYNTDIGQRGVKLSGGQKQRLSIARVFLKNPPILILDEATSSLDNESEEAIRQSLELLSAHRTTLVIAHRLSTVRHAQRIIVLSEGNIAEIGNHHELLARNGLYANLYNAHLTN
jgi:ATP-binding cassette, subfamily B, bacterial